jgi:hypothetical protein
LRKTGRELKKDGNMDSPLRIKAVQKTQALKIRSTEFPTAVFTYTIPEAIGSTDGSIWCSSKRFNINPNWIRHQDESWSYSWEREGVLGYSVHASTGKDHVDVQIKLRNLSEEAWPESQAFSCYNPRGAPEFADFEGTRTFVLFEKGWIPMTQVERKDHSRPTIQCFYLKDRPHPLGFVENLGGAPNVRPLGALAVRSYDGRHLTAVTSDRPLFLFHNLEFSCIHACPTFGALKAGEEGTAKHRVFICNETGLDQLTERINKFFRKNP